MTRARAVNTFDAKGGPFTGIVSGRAKTFLVTIPVTRRALFQRCARALAKKGQRLCAYRRGQSGTLGDHYIVDADRQRVVSIHEDLEALGWRLGVIKEFEAIEQIDEDAVTDAREKEREAHRTRAMLMRRLR